jgi:hypothetical protein
MRRHITIFLQELPLEKCLDKAYDNFNSNILRFGRVGPTALETGSFGVRQSDEG